MGHLLFFVLHGVCLVAFLPALIITIPLHLIYAVINSAHKKPRETSVDRPRTFMEGLKQGLEGTDQRTKKCPDCAETIRAEARVCRFCGHKFTVLDDLSEAA